MDHGATWSQMMRHGEGGAVRLATDVRGTYLVFAAPDPVTDEPMVRFLTKRVHHVLSANLATSLALPDNSAGGVVSSLTINSGAAMTDVGVWVDVRHGNAGQLTVKLTPPGGTAITIWQGANSRPWEGPIVFSAAGIPPAASIASLEGRSLVGTWQLQIVDGVAGTTGTLRDWGLRFR
jgi:subtilisin-like proprotein convertase family protein